MKTATHPTGKTITFNEHNHTYICDGKHHQSVTKLIHHQFPQFDTQKQAARYAKKHKLNTEDVIDQWEQNRDQAANFGTRVHKYCEDLLQGQIHIQPQNYKEQTYFNIINKNIEQILQQYEILHQEYIMFSPLLQIAGMADLIAKNKQTGNIVIIDWKTNKKIDRYSRWGETAHAPLQHISHCNYMHYALQLNLYQFLLHNENYYTEPIDRKIAHITAFGIDIMDAPNLQQDTKIIITNHIKALLTPSVSKS